MRLGDGIQIILQTGTDSEGYRCEGFSGIPIINPCFIAIEHSGSQYSEQEAMKLRQELVYAILSLSANAHSVEVPCHGQISSMMRCHAHGVEACQKLLLLIGDPISPIPNGRTLDYWTELVIRDPSYHLLPIFPKGASVQKLLPPLQQHFNAIFWSNSISEIIPAILSVVNLTANEFKIFISYRRTDSQALAEQLFEALSKENFDVYLDRFRTPPGINFQMRLTQELADKSMVLLLESTNILTSSWTRFEIAFTKLYRLGLFALNMPGGKTVSDIYPDQRECLNKNDFVDPIKCDVLTPDALTRVIEKIKITHGEALIRRRQLIRDCMKFSLLMANVDQWSIDSDGLLRVQSNSSGSTKNYSIWMTTRPAGLPDFQVSCISRGKSETGIIIGPAMQEPTRKEQIEWLADVCNIKNFDEGYIWLVAQMISGGVL
jgi:hypothetical protein